MVSETNGKCAQDELWLKLSRGVKTTGLVCASRRRIRSGKYSGEYSAQVARVMLNKAKIFFSG